MEVAKILREQLGRVGFVPKLLDSSPKADLKQDNAESVDVMHARASVSCRSLRLRMPILAKSGSGYGRCKPSHYLVANIQIRKGMGAQRSNMTTSDPQERAHS